MNPNRIKISTSISLFLISFSIFLYQVCLLRVISISDYYHFAFLIVSIALLGFGISGSFLYFFLRRIKDESLILILFSFSFAASIFISYVMINLIPFDSFKIAWEPKQVFYLFAYYFFLLLPFFFGGSFIGYVFYHEEKPQITYFYNLTGSAAGAIGFLLLVQPAGKTGVLLISILLGVTATFLVMSRKFLKLFIILTVIFAVLVAGFFVFIPSTLEVRMSPYKSLPSILRTPESEVIYSRENSTTRIDVVESPNIKSAPGLSLQYKDLLPEQIGITEDGDNLNPVTEIQDSDLLNGKLNFFEYMPISVIFELLNGGAVSEDDFSKNGRTAKDLTDGNLSDNQAIKDMVNKKILIIEPGGGLDIQGSIYLGAKESSITVVMENLLQADAVRDYSGYGGDIYSRDNVRLIRASSRNFCSTTNERFDLVILSLSDTFHPVSSGAYSLNENYIYSTESFKEMIKITDEDGIFAVTRWLQVPPSESLKVISTLANSLEQLDIQNISEKIFAFRSWSTVTVIFKQDGFTGSEIEMLKERLAALNYDLIYCSGAKPGETNIYNILDSNAHHEYFKGIIEGDKNKRSEIYSDYYFNIKPSSDSSPYFYNFFRLRQIPDIIKYFGKSTQPFGGGGYMVLIASLLISIFFSLLLIILPLKIRRIKLDIRSDYKFLLYFIALGIGFFFIELPLIQKFILILGNPAYSVSLILFALMLSAGLGSFTISRFRIDIKWTILLIVVFSGIFIFLLEYIQGFIISRPMWQRFIYSTLIISPLGFFMGMPFPSGILKAREKKPLIVPWLWAINGCASVVGSIAAVIISIHFGFTVVIGIAALLYISAFIVYRRF